MNNDQSIRIWQQIALATRNIVTPGNIISLFGLALVLLGVTKLYSGDWVAGLILLAAGRAMDLADGMAARATHTGSQLGELVDTTCDKVGVFAILLVAYTTGLLGPTLILMLVVYHLHMAVFAVLWGRRYRLHTNRWGKLAMFSSWVAILVSIIDTKQSAAALHLLSILATVSFGLLAVAAIYHYYWDLRRAIAAKSQTAAWTRRVETLLFVYNPKATNYQRARKWLVAIETRLKRKADHIDIIEEGNEALLKYLRKQRKPVLVMIAGGDGTVSSVVNQLCELKQPEIYILPLWGGNANDFSYMLNGLSSNQTAPHLLAQSAAIKVPLIKITTSKGEQGTKHVQYACCYASFGASAYAARQLEKRRLSTRSIARWLPPLVIIRELFAVLQALITSPQSRIRMGQRQTAFYEHSMINGSRIAKVNRVPIELNEPIFFHAIVEKKGTSILVNILRIIFRRPGTNYTKRSKAAFTTKSIIDAQIDGEILRLPSGTYVEATIAQTPLHFISSRLPH